MYSKLFRYIYLSIYFAKQIDNTILTFEYIYNSHAVYL